MSVGGIEGPRSISGGGDNHSELQKLLSEVYMKCSLEYTDGPSLKTCKNLDHFQPSQLQDYVQQALKLVAPNSAAHANLTNILNVIDGKTGDQIVTPGSYIDSDQIPLYQGLVQGTISAISDALSGSSTSAYPQLSFSQMSQMSTQIMNNLEDSPLMKFINSSNPTSQISLSDMKQGLGEMYSLCAQLTELMCRCSSFSSSESGIKNVFGEIGRAAHFADEIYVDLTDSGKPDSTVIQRQDINPDGSNWNGMSEDFILFQETLFGDSTKTYSLESVLKSLYGSH